MVKRAKKQEVFTYRTLSEGGARTMAMSLKKQGYKILSIEELPPEADMYYQINYIKEIKNDLGNSG
jgi:hypothetical protein